MASMKPFVKSYREEEKIIALFFADEHKFYTSNNGIDLVHKTEDYPSNLPAVGEEFAFSDSKYIEDYNDDYVNKHNEEFIIKTYKVVKIVKWISADEENRTRRFLLQEINIAKRNVLLEKRNA